MEMIQSNQTGTAIQLNLFESIMVLCQEKVQIKYNQFSLFM